MLLRVFIAQSYDLNDEMQKKISQPANFSANKSAGAFRRSVGAVAGASRNIIYVSVGGDSVWRAGGCNRFRQDFIRGDDKNIWKLEFYFLPLSLQCNRVLVFLRPGFLFFYVIIMAKETIYLTAEGYKKLKDELDHMRSVERPAISAAIAEARDKGDLSENAEYDAAREAQGLLEMRIAKLEDTMANARIIDESKINKDKVQILSKVTLLNHKTKKQVTYTIVAEHEANLREGKLAIGTPIAKALLGHKKGDCVEVEVPAGVMTFEIMDIGI